VRGIEKELREKFIEKRPPKNNLLSDHLDADALEWLEAMRRQK
jgi:hypothetical protein